MRCTVYKCLDVRRKLNVNHTALTVNTADVSSLSILICKGPSTAWPLRIAIFFLILVAFAILGILIGKELVRDTLFILAACLGFLSVFIAAGLLDLHHLTEKLASYVVNSKIKKISRMSKKSILFVA